MAIPTLRGSDGQRELRRKDCGVEHQGGLLRGRRTLKKDVDRTKGKFRLMESWEEKLRWGSRAKLHETENALTHKQVLGIFQEPPPCSITITSFDP